MTAHEMDEQVIARFRAGGEIEGIHRERLILLTTTGTRSGSARTSPMMFVPSVAGYPFFVEHQSRVEREIPLVELVPLP